MSAVAAHAPAATRPHAATGAPAARPGDGLRLVLVQTQAENAGAQEISRLLSEGLGARGHHVHQLFFFRRTSAFDDVPNVAFCAAERPRGPAGIARLLARLVAELRRLRPDAVLTFQHYGNLIGTPAARLAGVPLVVANQTSATLTTPSLARHLDLLAGAAGLFDRIVVNSQDAADAYHAYPARYRERLVRIDHGFRDKSSRLAKGDARRAFALPTDAVLIGSVARLHPLKNLAAAVRLLPHDPRWHLALAGQGPERDRLVALAASLGCADRLHCVGELPSGRVGDFLAGLDLFVFPSLAETFGLAAVEAAQAGVPVIANDIEVLREVLAVEGEPCAVFVDADDERAFAHAVRRVLHEHALAERLIAQGRQLKRRYSLKAMIDAYDGLLRELAAGRAKPWPA